MNHLELQTRANLIVDKVNAYEESLKTEKRLESDLINSHKYCDTNCIRPLIKLLLGDTVDKKLDRNLSNNQSLPVYASSAPMWNTKFDFISNQSSGFTLEDYVQPTNFVDVSELTNTKNCSTTEGNELIGFASCLNGTNLYHSGSTPNPHTITIHTNECINLTSMKFQNRIESDSNAIWPIKNIIIETSTDGSTFTQVASYENSLLTSGAEWIVNCTTNDNFVNYIRLTMTGNSNTYVALNKCNIVGKIKKYEGSGQHEFINSIDLYNKYNMITLDTKQHQLGERSDRIKQGINYSISSNIQDALVTESQVANVFDWNTTTDEDLLNNTQTVVNQVPGIVLYYLGNGFDGTFSSNIGCNNSKYLNNVEFNTPPTYGVMYQNLPIDSTVSDWLCYNNVINSQRLETENEQGDDLGICCRVFYLGCTYTRGKLESPQQIWQPIRGADVTNEDEFGRTYNGKWWATNGINWQGRALYHELVFKNRRSGTSALDLDFVPGLNDIPDNDPQGLATRLALAKQKDYYINRAWFNELDVENKFDTSILADKMLEEEEKTISTGVVNTDIITLNGSLTNTNGVITGFSSSNYITLKDLSKVDFGTKIHIVFTPEEISNEQALLTVDAQIHVSNVSGTLYDWETAQSVLGALTAGETYSLDYELTGANLQTWNFNGIDGTTTNTLSLPPSSNIYIGFRPDYSSRYWRGSIDLTKSYITYPDGTKVDFCGTQTTKYVMTDEEFYKNYKLDYNTYAKLYNQSM